MKTYLPNIIVKSGLILSLLTSSASSSEAQHLIFGNNMEVELGLNFGPTFFLGDLGGNAGYGTKFVKDVNLELTKMMKGAFVAVYPTDWIGLRLAAQYTYVSGRDNIINTKGVNELWRKQRNLNFKSNMWEAYGAIEFYPTLLLASGEEYQPTYQPYGFIGVGVFHFNPKGSITNQFGSVSWHELHPLRTEGQGMAEYPDKKPYKLTQMNIPMGCGIKRIFNSNVTAGLELLYRKTFTDYIDDVSTTYIDPYYFSVYLNPRDAAIARQIHDKTVGIVTPGVSRYEPGTQRGNSKNMDAYFSFLLKVGIRLGPSSDEWGRAKRQTRCPHFY